MHKDCILSATFTKMVAVVSAKWRGAPPFSVISVLGQVHVLYRNPGTKKAQWQSLRRACHAWQSRHELLRECFEPDFEERQEKYKGTACLQDFDYKKTVEEGAEYLESKNYLEDNKNSWRWHDLDPNATCIILTDGLKIDSKAKDTGAKPKRDRAPFLSLISAIINHLASTVPSLAIKTGASMRSSKLEKMGSEPMSLAMLIDRTMSGTPVLCLDVRRRTDIRELACTEAGKLSVSAAGTFEASRRISSVVAAVVPQGTRKHAKLARSSTEAKLVQSRFAEVMTDAETKQNWREMVIILAKAEIKRGIAKMHKVGKCESLDCAMMAYVNEALIVGESEDRVKQDLFKAINKALKHSEDRRRGVKEAIREQTVHDESGTRATAVQITSTADWFARTFYENVFEVCGHLKGDTVDEMFSKEILMMATHARSLFLSSCFYTANIWQLEMAKALMLRLVRLDRLPEYTSAQGLLLLRDAWCEVDVASHLADQYKWNCKALFIVQITLAWLVVVAAAVSSYLDPCADQAISIYLPILQQLTFITALLLTAVISLQGMYNSRPRWRQLRNGANSLESIIWMYRTRVGRFEVDESNRRADRPEKELEVISIALPPFH